MHELSIAQSIITIVEKSVPADFDKTPSSIHLLIGVLSGIETDALQFGFNVLKVKTRLKNSKLVFEMVPGLAICNDCNYDFEVSSFGQECPLCKSFSLTFSKGREMKVLKVVSED